MPTPNPSQLRTTLPLAGHVGDRRPTGWLPQLENVVVEVQELGGLTEGVALGVPPVLAGTDDGSWRVPVTVEPHEGSTDALANVPVVAVHTPSLVHAAGPRQRVGQEIPVPQLRAIVVPSLDADLSAVILRHDVG